MMTVRGAQARICAAFAPAPAEWADLDEAAGRALAAPIHARRSHPARAVSAMDGYALRAADAAQPGATLPIAQWIAAGDAAEAPLPDGACARIFTGAALPPGADAVIVQEDAEAAENGAVGETARFAVSVEAGAYVRPEGLDFRDGAMLLKPGVPITARAAALAASAGHVRLPVARRPRIAVLATGDEVALPGEPVAAHGLISSNSVTLKTLIRRFGGEPVDLGLARDDEQALRDAVARAAGCDLLVTTGGASAGAHDFVSRLMQDSGAELDFWKIAMRPGKPLLFGRVASGTPLLGLPGNPVSTFVCAALFLRPAMRRMLGLEPAIPPLETATLAAKRPAGGPRESYLRALFVDDIALGGRAVRLDDRQDSAQQAGLAEAQVLLKTPVNAPETPRGETVEILPLNFD